MPIVNQSEFARMVKTSRSNINQYVKRGAIVVTASGKIDTEDKVNKQVIQEITERIRLKSEPNVIPTKKDMDSGKLSDSASHAKRAQEVLKYKKLEMEVKLLQGELVRKDAVGDACFEYLGALNLNIMEMPQSFLDELEGSILNKESRLKKMEIVTKPICEAINAAINQVEKKLKQSNEN